RIKRLTLATRHEKHSFPEREGWFGPKHDNATLGYAVAVQGPNEVIHLLTSMNHPNLHFALNEAWILSDIEEEVD
ncbi:MAG: hypothetical protein HYZ00_00135, partial [Candidatus Hydrogenedentes bacterium]|nr:hypothetical protein [Candidatus Hydrogenedentota bacterium]